MPKNDLNIGVNVNTNQGAKEFEKLGKATEKARKATEKNNEALKRASLEYLVAKERAKNTAESISKFEAAEKRATATMRLHQRAVGSQAAAYGKLQGAVRGAASRIRVDAVGAFQSIVSIGRQAISTTVDLAQESLELTNVFDNLPFSLNLARKATRGLADDATLAKNAILAHQAGVTTTGEAYAEMVGNAQVLALKLGRDVNDAIERVTLGIAKQEREILDELIPGLARMEEIWGDAAEAMGKTTSQLTDLEKNTAFTVEVQKKLREATQGVETDMDGAAGAIARTVVEMKNMKTAALGAEEPNVTLAKGMTLLDAKTLKLAANYAQYGADVSDVNQALRDVGVNTSELVGTQGQLQKQMRRLIETEAARIGNRAEDNELSKEQIERAEELIATGAVELQFLPKLIELNKERLGLTQAQIEARAELAAEDAAILPLKREALELVEEDIAALRGRGGEEKEINFLIVEQLELKSEILEAEGDLEEAAKVRRRAEVAAAKAAGGEGKRRGGGRGRRGPSRLTKERLARERQDQIAFASAQEQGERRRAIQLARRRDTDPFSEANLEQQLTNVVDFEERRGALVLQARLREIEAMRAAGVDPRELADRETEAQLRAITTVEEARERQFGREIVLAQEQGRLSDERTLRAEREVSALDIQDQREQVAHEAALRRLEERGAKEVKVRKFIGSMVDQGAEQHLQAAETIARATIIEGKSLTAAVGSTAAALAKEHAILAASEGIRAIIAVARYDYGAAALHGANAAASAAFAASMGALAAGAGGFSDTKTAGPAGFGAESFGQGSSQAAAGQGQQQQRQRSGVGGDVPISQESATLLGDATSTDSLDRSGQAANAAPGPGGVVVQQKIEVNTLGNPDEQTMMALEKAQRKAGNRIGRLRAGG